MVVRCRGAHGAAQAQLERVSAFEDPALPITTEEPGKEALERQLHLQAADRKTATPDPVVQVVRERPGGQPRTRTSRQPENAKRATR